MGVAQASKTQSAIGKLLFLFDQSLTKAWGFRRDWTDDGGWCYLEQGLAALILVVGVLLKLKKANLLSASCSFCLTNPLRKLGAFDVIGSNKKTAAYRLRPFELGRDERITSFGRVLRARTVSASVK